MKKIVSLFLVLFVLLVPFLSFANPVALPMSTTFYEALILGATGAAAAGSVSQMTEEEKRQLDVAMKISNPFVSAPLFLTGMDAIHTAMANELGTMTPAQKRAFMKAAVNQAFLTSGQPSLAPALAPDASLDTLTQAYDAIRDSVYIPLSFNDLFISDRLKSLENFLKAAPSNVLTSVPNYQLYTHYSVDPRYVNGRIETIFYYFYRPLTFFDNGTVQTTECFTVVHFYDLQGNISSTISYTTIVSGSVSNAKPIVSDDYSILQRFDAFKKSLEQSISNDKVIGLSLKFLEDGVFSTKDVVTFPSETLPWAKQTSTGRFELPYLPDLENPVFGGPIPFPKNPAFPLPQTIPYNPAIPANPAYPWVDDPKALPYDIPKNPAIPIPKNPAIPANPAIPTDATKVLPFFPDVTVPDFDFSPLFVPIPEKFPFCIPFDLVNAFTNFSNLTGNTQWQPVWHVPFLTEDIVVDITMFNPIAKVIRYFVFLIFVVGLIHSTRKLIRG